MKQQEVMGRIIRDKITLVEGVCIGVLDWISGCRIYKARLRSPDRAEDRHYLSYCTKDIPESCMEVVDEVPVIDATFPEEEEPKFFGKVCRDKITGFKGTCIGRIWLFYSEKQYCLETKVDPEKIDKTASMWVDEGRIEVIESEDSVAVESVQSLSNGAVTDVEVPDY